MDNISKDAVQAEPENMEDVFFETFGIRILRSLRRITRAVDIHSRKLNSEFKITSPQLLCLYNLAKQGSLTLSKLSNEVNLCTSTVNGIVDRLESKALLFRRRGTDDKRRVYLEITEQGREVTKSAPLLLQESFSAGLRALSELEQASIALSLERVVKLMEEVEIDLSASGTK